MRTAAVADPQRTAMDIAFLCGALALPSAVALAIDARTLNEVSVWAKPLKFQLSFALHWLTVAWLMGCVSRDAWARPSLRWALRVGGLAAVVEVLYITLQAARGRASHFNFSTPLETLLYYALMGGAALLLMLATAWVGVMAWRHPPGDRRDALWLGAVLGLVGGSIVTLLVTAPLAAGAVDGPGHWVGGVRSDAGGLPLVGWSTTGGDLRVPHFVATHLLQALPLVGWWSVRLRLRHGHRWVWGAACVGLVVLGAVLAQALAAQPLWTPGTGASD